MAREQLIKEAEAKFERERLIAEAEQKWAAENPEPQEKPGALERLETAARSGFESATLGISEPAISGVNAVLGNMIDAGFEAEDLKDFFSKSIDAARVKKEYQSDIARRRELEAQLPVESLAGSLVGAFAPVGPAAAVGKLATKAVQAGAKAIPGVAALEKAAILAPAIRAGKTAAESAAGAAAAVGAEQAIERATGFMTPEEGMPIGEAALFGAKLGGGIKALAEGAQAAKVLGQRAVEVFGGPKAEMIERYLADPETVKRAKSATEIKELLDESVAKLKTDLEAKVIDVDTAKDALRKAEQQVRDVSQAKKADIVDALKVARESFKEASQEIIQPLKQAKPSQGLAQDIIDAADDLRSKVREESEKSYSILDRMEADAKAKKLPRANLADVPDFITTLQEDLKVNGKLISQEEQRAYAVLNRYKTDLKSVFKEQTPWPQVKRIIQSIDRDIRTYSMPNSAEFSDLARGKLLELRRSIDQVIKTTSPEYAAQMQKVSDLTELLGETATFLGRDERIQGKLENIWKTASKPQQDLVLALGAATNRNLAQPMNAYIQAKQLAAQPAALEAMAQALPQAKAVRQMEAQVARLRRPGAEQILAPQEVRAAQRAGVQLSRAETIAQKAREDLQSVGGFASQASNINAIRGAVAGRNPDYIKRLKALSQLSNQDFVAMVDDLRMAEAFSRDFTQGSRNVNFFSILAGGAIYGATGSLELAAITAGAGAGVGKMMDKFGGQVTQQVLDAYLSIKGLPSVKKLDAALSGLPDEVKNYAINDFVRAVAIVKNQKMNIPADQVPQLVEDLRTSDLDSISRMKALEDVRKNQMIDSELMKRAMLGQAKPQPLMMPKKDEALKEDKPDILKKMSGL